MTEKYIKWKNIIEESDLKGRKTTTQYSILCLKLQKIESTDLVGISDVMYK